MALCQTHLINQKIRKELNENKIKVRVQDVAIESKRKQQQKIFYGGSGICHTLKKIGKILGEGVYKEGHSDMENGKCVLRTIGPIWLDHKVYILCRGVKITKI